MSDAALPTPPPPFDLPDDPVGGWSWSRDFAELKHLGPNDWRLDIDMGIDFQDEDRRFLLRRNALTLLRDEQRRLWKLPDEEVTRLVKEQREKDQKFGYRIKPRQ